MIVSLCVKVVRTEELSEESFQSLLDFSKAMKKVPVVCKVGVACYHGDLECVFACRTRQVLWSTDC